MGRGWPARGQQRRIHRHHPGRAIGHVRSHAVEPAQRATARHLVGDAAEGRIVAAYPDPLGTSPQQPAAHVLQQRAPLPRQQRRVAAHASGQAAGQHDAVNGGGGRARGHGHVRARCPHGRDCTPRSTRCRRPRSAPASRSGTGA
ncbi:hypothetical protein G6F68_013196 [Rhizopus microsporus]|nr:hypothetical protein G6F68_013196 [Rhizopus microsporus]